MSRRRPESRANLSELTPSTCGAAGTSISVRLFEAVASITSRSVTRQEKPHLPGYGLHSRGSRVIRQLACCRGSGWHVTC